MATIICQSPKADANITQPGKHVQSAQVTSLVMNFITFWNARPSKSSGHPCSRPTIGNIPTQLNLKLSSRQTRRHFFTACLDLSSTSPMPFHKSAASSAPPPPAHLPSLRLYPPNPCAFSHPILWNERWEIGRPPRYFSCLIAM